MIIHVDENPTESQLLQIQLKDHPIRTFDTAKEAFEVAQHAESVACIVTDWYLDTSSDEIIRDALIKWAVKLGIPVAVYSAFEVDASDVPDGVPVIKKSGPQLPGDLRGWFSNIGIVGEWIK